MKVNWGTGIVIAIIAFMGFILFFVIKMSSNKKYSYDLVSEKYYQKELVYQQEIDAAKNASELEENVSIKRTIEGLRIYFPKDFSSEEIKGKVFLYRPSNKQLDFEIPISFSNTYLLVPEDRLLDGRWNIIVKWKIKDKDFLFKEELIY